MANETIETSRTAPVASWTALENTRLAYERTLMAWTRTAVSLISFGFTIYKFLQFAEENQAHHVERLLSPRGVGVVMISTGLFALILAAWDHRRCMKRLRLQYPEAQASLSWLLAAIISLFGIMALLATLFQQ